MDIALQQHFTQIQVSDASALRAPCTEAIVMTDLTETRAAGGCPCGYVLILFVVSIAVAAVFPLGVQTDVAETFHEGGWGMWLILVILILSACSWPSTRRST